MHYAGPDADRGERPARAVRRARGKIARHPVERPGGLRQDGRDALRRVRAYGSDRALIWWDGNQEGPTQATNTEGKGVFEFLNDGKNVGYAAFTKTEPKLFDKSASVIERNALDYYPGGVAPTPTPCPQCPANGGTPS